MSLDTVLKIGQILRHSEDNIKFFDKIVKCPYDKKKELYPICFNINVSADYCIQWDTIKFTPENEKDNLYYLKYRTSDRDSSVKYLFGDIYYQRSYKEDKKTNKTQILEDGFYRNRDKSKTSFELGKKDADYISKKVPELNRFRNSIEKNRSILENILDYFPAINEYLTQNELKKDTIYDYLNDTSRLKKETIEINRKNLDKKSKEKEKKKELDDDILSEMISGEVFVHFVFENNIHWYNNQQILNSITSQMLSEYVAKNNDKIILNKSLYKTICSGNDKNDIQFPNFDLNSRYKCRSFTQDEINDLFYAISYTKKGLSIPNTDIKLIVLPKGENLKCADYITFSEKANELNIVSSNEGNQDDLWSDSYPVTSFDLIFCKKGGMSSPDTDLIEISNIEKSHLFRIRERLNKISSEILNEEKDELKTSKNITPLTISFAFRNILGIPEYKHDKVDVEFNTNKKYQSHLLKVLPSIYLGTYYHDEYLLTSFIQNVEYTVRADCQKYLFLKYSLKFLLSIQNNKNNYYMQITNSESYKLGKDLGYVAKPLGRKINTFQKNYVGLITRRASSKNDCIQLTNDIIEKLVMHDCGYNTSLCGELCSKIASLNHFDKEEFAFGFFEGYFTYNKNFTSDNFLMRAEKLVADYKEKQEFNEVINEIENAIINYKNIK